MNTFVSKTLYIFTILFIVALIAIVAKEVFVLFLPIVIAYIIARTINPLKNLLHTKLKFPIQLSSLVSMIIIIGLFVMLFYFLGNVSINQLSSLTSDLPELGNAIYSSLESANNKFESFIKITPVIFDDVFKNIMDFFVISLGDFSKNIAKILLNFITIIPNLLFYSFITLIATYYISNDLKPFNLWWEKTTSKFTFISNTKKLLKNDILFALGAYLKAQGILMIITFVIISIGLLIMGYKYFLLIALGIAILDALPILGTGTIFGPWIIIELLNGNYRIAIFLTAIYLIATVTRQILQPKILSSQIGTNPLLTLISIYIGIRLLGVFGIILGPIIMILLTSIIKIIKNTDIISLKQ